jgi:hypothetical protein
VSHVLYGVFVIADGVGGSIDDLKSEAQVFKRSAFALSTQKTYRSQLRKFFKFCIEYSRSPLPVSQETLICYTAFLARSLLPTSIPQYLNVIRIFHLEAGHENPLAQSFELNLLKRGIKREKGVPPKQKSPITISILRRFFAVIDLDNPADLSFWAVCTLGFFGFMRKSTMLPVSAKDQVVKMLIRDDLVQLNLESFVLQIHHSKVIQFGEKVHCLPFVRCEDCALCPVRAIMSHFGASPLGASRPLFNYLLAGREVFLTQSLFVKRL